MHFQRFCSRFSKIVSDRDRISKDLYGDLRNQSPYCHGVSEFSPQRVLAVNGVSLPTSSRCSEFSLSTRSRCQRVLAVNEFSLSTSSRCQRVLAVNEFSLSTSSRCQRLLAVNGFPLSTSSRRQRVLATNEVALSTSFRSQRVLAVNEFAPSTSSRCRAFLLSTSFRRQRVRAVNEFSLPRVLAVRQRIPFAKLFSCQGVLFVRNLLFPSVLHVKQICRADEFAPPSVLLRNRFLCYLRDPLRRRFLAIVLGRRLGWRGENHATQFSSCTICVHCNYDAMSLRLSPSTGSRLRPLSFSAANSFNLSCVFFATRLFSQTI